MNLQGNGAGMMNRIVKDMSMKFYYGAGVNYMFGKWGLGLNYLHFNLDGSFDGFDISNADIGGDLLLGEVKFSF